MKTHQLRLYNEMYAATYPERVFALNLEEAIAAGRQLDDHPPHTSAHQIAHETAVAWAAKHGTAVHGGCHDGELTEVADFFVPTEKG